MAVTEKELSLVGEVEELYSRSRDQKKKRYSRWDRNYLLTHNRVWSAARPQWRPSPAASEIFPILSALAAWMTDQRSSFEVVPSADPHTPFFDLESRLARDLQKVLESLWFTKDWDEQVEKVIWDAFIYGTGFFKILWDPAADDEGNPRLVRVDPYTIFPDPNATSFEDLSYIIETRRMSKDELDRRFPGASSLIEGGAEGSVDQRVDLFSGGNTPMANPGNMPGSSSSSYGLPGQSRDKATSDSGVVVHEAWMRDSELWTDEEGEEFTQDRWRMVVTAGNTVLRDEWAEDLWGQATHPFVRYTVQDLGELWGIALVDHLAAPQQALNRLLASLQANAEMVGNPIWMQDSRAGIDRTQIPNKPGTRLTKNAGGEADFIRPPEMPQFVFQMLSFWTQEMEKISGLSAMVRGHGENKRQAQGTMEQVQESAFVRVRAALRSLERSLRKVGEHVASLVVENYTTPRTVAVVGPQGEQTALSLMGRHFFSRNDDDSDDTPLKFQLWIRAGSALPTSRQARAQESDMLFAMGAIDRQAVLDAHDYPGRQEIIKRLQQRDLAGAMQGHAPSQGPGARQRARRHT